MSTPPSSPRPKKTTKYTLFDIQLKLTLYRFYAQIGFSLIVVSLCVWQLTTKNEFQPAERAIYWSSLSGTVANWLPSPLEKVTDDTRRLAKRSEDDEDDEED